MLTKYRWVHTVPCPGPISSMKVCFSHLTKEKAQEVYGSRLIGPVLETKVEVPEKKEGWVVVSVVGWLGTQMATSQHEATLKAAKLGTGFRAVRVEWED